MKYKNTILLFAFLISLQVFCQEKTESINNISSFFFSDFKANSDLEIDKTYNKIIEWSLEEINGTDEKPPFVKSDSIKKYFTSNEIDFIKKQLLDLNRNKFWTKKIMSDFTLIDESGLDQIVKNSMSKRKRKHINNYCYLFSIPIFSKDFSKVIIKQEYFCGFLCSTQCIYIYEKQENGLWREITNWECWSS